jgi:hypothetical protein
VADPHRRDRRAESRERRFGEGLRSYLAALDIAAALFMRLRLPVGRGARAGRVLAHGRRTSPSKSARMRAIERRRAIIDRQGRAFASCAHRRAESSRQVGDKSRMGAATPGNGVASSGAPTAAASSYSPLG